MYPGAELADSEFRTWAHEQARLHGSFADDRLEAIDRDRPSVSVPEEVGVDDPPPAVTIRPGRSAQYALEFATEVDLFWPESTGTRQQRSSFVATWETGWRNVTAPLQEVVAVPADLWRRLRGDRIFVRLLTRTSNDPSWPDLESSAALDAKTAVPSIRVVRSGRDLDWLGDDASRRRAQRRWSERPVDR